MGLFVVRNERKNSIKYPNHSVKLNPTRPRAVYGIILVTLCICEIEISIKASLN